MFESLYSDQWNRGAGFIPAPLLSFGAGKTRDMGGTDEGLDCLPAKPQLQRVRPMTAILIASALFCLSLPAALLAALAYNDRDARRAEAGNEIG